MKYQIARLFFIFLFSVSVFHHCAVWEEAGLPGYQSVSGRDAKKEISEATLEAVATGQLLWLSQNGMQTGVGIIGPLAFLNGFLVSFLQPILSDIPDTEYYTRESVDSCTKDIRGKGALIYGSFLDRLPSGGLVTGSVRDAILLPELASCDLNKTGRILYISPWINL